MLLNFTMELTKKLHFFHPEVATKYGVDEAIMLSHLIYWIATNSIAGRNYIDGRHWTFNSAVKFAQYLPYWSEGQIRRVLKSLLKQDIIIDGNYDGHKYDRTKWYALYDEKYWLTNYHPVNRIDNWEDPY